MKSITRNFIVFQALSKSLYTKEHKYQIKLINYVLLNSFNGTDFSCLFRVGLNSSIDNASDNFLFMVFLRLSWYFLHKLFCNL